VISLIVYQNNIESNARRILRNVDCPEFLVDSQINNNEDWMLGQADDLTKYIEINLKGVPSITSRPEMQLTADKNEISADSADAATISGVPEGATVTSGEDSMTIEDGVLEFVTDKRGEHVLKFECFPYINTEVVINAV